MSETTVQGSVNANPLRRAADRLFGGINMSWVKVILLAVASAAVTAVFLILPIFDNTSFREMGVTFEAWVLFAIFIMVNCKTPLESAIKTFVFFLISQPLIYLIQVPFSYMGWGLFGYYRTWFIWTLFTFPMAFIGWYLKKGNWLSLLILTPINLMLAYTAVGYIKSHLIPSFPNHLIAVLFCFMQIALYLLVFFRGWQKRLVGAAVPLILVVIVMLITPSVDTGAGMPVPDDPVLSESATIRLEDNSYGDASLTVDNGEGYMYVHMVKNGSVKVVITDGDKEYRYTAEVVYENGHYHMDITPVK